ncbi:hypothetical protein Tco_1441475 [Tanacetum coccineum]
MVTLFRVVQTLCKQGDWFSFAKRRASSSVCINDNHSCMKHWKSGFFLIDRRAIPDYMTWRHPNSVIDDPKPAAGSYRMANVRRLSAHVVKLRDMPEGVLLWVFTIFSTFLSGLVLRFKRSPIMISDQPFRGFYFTVLPFAAVDVDVLDPTLEDLAANNPSAKVIDKAEASQKRKASTSGAALGHVAKLTRSAVAQSSGSTTRPNLFADDSGAESDDDDAC